VRTVKGSGANAKPRGSGVKGWRCMHLGRVQTRGERVEGEGERGREEHPGECPGVGTGIRCGGLRIRFSSLT
jgi:hypothetical protein